MFSKLDTKRIMVFLAFAFGIAWMGGLVIYLTGGLADSPELIPGTNFTLALVLVTTVYMWSPALANILTRLVTREGRQELYIQPYIKRSWRSWVAAWFLPGILTILGAVVFFLFFPQYFDPTLSFVRDSLAAAEQAGQSIPIPPQLIVAIQIVQGLLLAPVINSLFTFGEEFGWRAYLQPRLMPLGKRNALLWVGVIWGIWHWPVIAMGHNYGLEYAGAPWLGLLAMVWFTLVTGTFLGWLALRGGSVWPAVIGHAALNGIAGIGILFARGGPNTLLGPLPTGLIGSVAWAIVALWIFWRAKLDETET